MSNFVDHGSRSSGLRVVAGEAALDGSNPTPINFAGKLRKVIAVVLTYKGTSTPGDTHSIMTYDIVSDTLVNVYGWVHQAADPTLVASTATPTFSYIAIGY